MAARTTQKKPEPVEALAAAEAGPPTGLTASQIAALTSDLDPRRVQKREGSGRQSLSYLMTHDVKRAANRIFGFDGWGYVVESLHLLGEEPVKSRNGKDGFRVGYRATVTVTVVTERGAVHRGDTGYGDAVEYTGSRITPHELASKEAVSDAIKRCLSSWGDQFGLVLYGADPAPPVEPAAEPTPPAESRETKAADLVVDFEEIKRMVALAHEAGFSDDQVKTVCRNEFDANGGYRRSWLREQLQQLNKAIEARAAA